MACKKFTREDLEKFINKKCIIYFQGQDTDTANPYTASVSGVVRLLTPNVVFLNWGYSIVLAKIKRVILREEPVIV